MKKILIVITSLVVAFTFVYVQPVQKVQAVILSKVASATAKKAVKEIVKDIAIETAVNFALGEAFKIMDEGERAKYKLQNEYELFCGKKMPDLITCEKPMQVKGNLTDFDKVAIGNQAEIEFDKLITNGKGFTRWQKFLDWFLPIWVASFALTAITYAVDPEVRSLFNEAGYNALVALGLIIPAYENVIAPIADKESELPPKTITNGNQNGELFTLSSSTGGSTITHDISVGSQPNENMMIISQFNNPEGTTFGSYDISFNGYLAWQLHGANRTINFYPSIFGQLSEMVIYTMGTYKSTTAGKTTSSYPVTVASSGFDLPSTKMKSVMTRLPYMVDGFWYTDILFNTVEGWTLHIQAKSANNFIPEPITNVKVESKYGGYSTAIERQMTSTVYPNVVPNKKVLLPVYDDIPETIAKSDYEDDEGNIALIPPSALPYTQTSTGVQLTPQKDESTGEQKFTTPTGETVPEDDITVGEPNVQDNPSPTPNTVTPPASQTNPNPEPIPLVPGVPPPTPPTTGEPPPPEDGGGGKPNIPMSLLIGLFKLLFAIIFYLIRMFTFIVTIQFIQPIPIPNPYFLWFTEATILGVQPYPLIKNIALFFLSFSIYKSIRRVFG